MADPATDVRKKEERRSFLFLTVVMAPVLSVMIVGGYGFVVWIAQLFTGPPVR
jgi:periplasmic nitrate reductase NapE